MCRKGGAPRTCDGLLRVGHRMESRLTWCPRIAIYVLAQLASNYPISLFFFFEQALIVAFLLRLGILHACMYRSIYHIAFSDPRCLGPGLPGRVGKSKRYLCMASRCDHREKKTPFHTTNFAYRRHILLNS